MEWPAFRERAIVLASLGRLARDHLFRPRALKTSEVQKARIDFGPDKDRPGAPVQPAHKREGRRHQSIEVVYLELAEVIQVKTEAPRERQPCCGCKRGARKRQAPLLRQ